MDKQKLLTINDLKKYLNSKEFEDDVLFMVYDCLAGARFEVFLSGGIDDSWLDENGFIDININ